MKIKSFCINLQRAQDRKIKFEENWKTILGDELEYFEAIDGRFLNNTPYLTARGLGCLRSHLKCMELALKTNYEHFLFFQDDAVPEVSNISEVIEFTYNLTNSDIIFCCLRKKYVKYIKEKYNIPDSQEFSVVKGMPMEVCEGACMVFFTRKGIEQYIETFKCEKYHADWYRVLGNCNISLTIPPLCDHADDDSYISDHYGREFIF